MSIFVRIAFAFALVVMLAGALIFNAVQKQIKPNLRQVVETLLAEDANLMAGMVASDVAHKQVQTPAFAEQMQHILNRRLNATIWQNKKNNIDLLLYITDTKGRVIYHSNLQEIGQDYSRWNDVYLTLRGQYGARSTRSNPNDSTTSTMYVAAPIVYQQRLVGVLTLGKPSFAVQQFIDQTRQDMLYQIVLFVGISILMVLFIAWWLRRSIKKVRNYALSLAPTTQLAPHFYSASELNDLCAAIYHMRSKLEDRAYIEQYVSTLTHELKSPLTAIMASAEILTEPVDLNHQQQFANNILQQADRLKLMVDRLLLLSQLESLTALDNLTKVDVVELLNNLLEQKQSLFKQKNIQLVFKENTQQLTLIADAFWLQQALSNVLDNAIDFCPVNGDIVITATIALENAEKQLHITISNSGEPIPAYALNRLFERYFSLPRPHNGQKSTGIGLTLVAAVVKRLQGDVSIVNTNKPSQGVQVQITLPVNTLLKT